MTIKEILSKGVDLKRHEIRAERGDYAEIVFRNEELGRLTMVLSGALGPAQKQSGVGPAKEHQEITKEYGGIRANQTLFKKEFGSTAVVAVLWPWQSGPYITLKMFTAADSKGAQS